MVNTGKRSKIMPLKTVEVENPGQRFISNFIIYSALGEPVIKPEDWSLKVSGRVKKPFSLSFKEVMEMPHIEYISDFNCVTAWSIKSVKWEGPSLRDLIAKADPESSAEWVMFRCADGYSTPVPIEYAITEDAVVAVKMNGEPLRTEQGFPARPFMPELYAWKSAKWLTEIELIDEYEDGYWEAYGYHERGLVSDGERYTGGAWKRIKKNVTGMFKV